ncbi:SDR family oxidoreductase [bacterium]|nr:SDR family oxidoreductase [bacterium]
MEFDGKVVVVTGAGAGIGRAVSSAFSEKGAKLVLNDIDEKALDKACKDFPGSICVKGDVSEPDTAIAIAKAATDNYRHVDILINNAGISKVCSAEKLSIEDWQRIIAVNLSGPYYVARAIGKQMIQQKAGCIINIASMAGLHGIPENVAYVASKHGVVGLTKSLVIEWARYGIRVNCVCPGLTATPLVKSLEQQAPKVFEERKKRIPIGRLSKPEEQALVILFLASDAASYVSGLIANVDAGSHALYSGYSLPVDD